MCLVVPSRVVALDGAEAVVEFPDGQQATVNACLATDVRLGDYVLVDRGLILKVIEASEAEAILAMYAEYGDLMAEAS